MPADLEFEAEWILSVHRVGVVPKEDPSHLKQLAVGENILYLVSKLSGCVSLCLWQRRVLG